MLTSSWHALNYHSEKWGFLSNIQKTVQSNTNLPSPKAQHDALLLLMSIVSTELLDVRRLEACNVLWLCLLHCPRSCERMNGWSNRYNKWFPSKLYTGSFILTCLPIMSAVSFLSTKICTFTLASPSASRGKTNLNVPAQCACTFAIHDPDTTLAELLLGQETEEYL